MNPQIWIVTKFHGSVTLLLYIPQVSLPQLSEPVEISPGLYTRRQSGKEKKVHLPGTGTCLCGSCKLSKVIILWLGTFCDWDVPWTGTFGALGRWIWMRRFVKRIWIKRRFVAGQSITFCGLDLFCSWDILWSGMFSVGCGVTLCFLHQVS
jgi:hypothetical protein